VAGPGQPGFALGASGPLCRPAGLGAARRRRVSSPAPARRGPRKSPAACRRSSNAAAGSPSPRAASDQPGRSAGLRI